MLIWLWFTLHSKRLRDAGVGSGLVAGVALLYALSVVLLVIVEASFAGAISGQTGDAKAASGLELILLVSVIALLLGSAHYDLTSAVVAILLAVEFIPIVLAIGTTIWAAIAAKPRSAIAHEPALCLWFEYEPRRHAQARTVRKADGRSDTGKLSLPDHHGWLCFGRATPWREQFMAFFGGSRRAI